jgi:hypothetical protein
MVYRAHFGKDSDQSSLSRWIKRIYRNRQRLWDNRKSLIKDFRACQGLVDVVLDGYLIGAIATASGCEDARDLASGLSAAHLSEHIDELCDRLSDFEAVNTQRARSVGRDRPHENFILFMQHGLILRNFSDAMKTGDVGRVLASLSYFTIWFQATRQHNYARETLHLTACLKRIWSPDLVQFWKENCLINTSGKIGGWMACDLVNEYVVRENKSLAPPSMTEALESYLCNSLAPQMWVLFGIKRKMADECDTNRFGNHSSSVKTSSDVKVLVSELVDSNFCRDLRTRNAEDESEALDLFVVGLGKLATTQRLAQYKRDFIKKGIIRLDIGSEDEVDDEMEEDEPEDGAEDINHFVSDSESDDGDDGGTNEW